MRRIALLVCLVLVACGDDEDTGGSDGGSGTSGDSGSGGAGHSGGNNGGHAGAGAGAGKGGAGGGSAGNGGHSGGGGSNHPVGKIRLVPNIVAGSRMGSESGSGVGSQQAALRVGSPSATTLLSLKYYLTSIQICQELEPSGSGFMNTKGCVNLYNNQPAGSPDYSTYTIAEAQADTTEGHYIDLMSAAGQAALRKPVMVEVPLPDPSSLADPTTDDDADGGVAAVDDAPPGAFKYGLINFYRPIKVTAEFPIIGETDSFFRTKTVTNILETPGLNGGLGNETVRIGDTLMAPTEETVYMLNNGGAWFTFQKPFEITQADIDNNVEIKVDLVFNPDHFGQAYSSDCVNDQRVVICDPTNGVSIDMPFVRMNPVPRKTGERTRKEIYLLDYDDYSQLRIELYYNDGDSQKGIQGVDTALIYKANAASAPYASFNTIASNFVSQTGTLANDDASVSLLDYQRNVNLDGLVRRQDGTATIHCLFTGSVCQTIGDTFTRPYTYATDVVVSTD